MSDDTAAKIARLEEHIGKPPWLQCVGWDGETLFLYSKTRRPSGTLPTEFEGSPVVFVPLGMVRPLTA